MCIVSLQDLAVEKRRLEDLQQGENITERGLLFSQYLLASFSEIPACLTEDRALKVIWPSVSL